MSRPSLTLRVTIRVYRVQYNIDRCGKRPLAVRSKVAMRQTTEPGEDLRESRQLNSHTFESSTMTSENLLPSRRELLCTAAAGVVGMLGSPAASRADERQAQTVRDKLWIWSHVAGAHNKDWEIPRPSRMTPVEGAVYLDVPNLMFIRYEGKPELPFDAFAISFRPLKQVVCSLTGSGGDTSDEERQHVLQLAEWFPNITGFIMDDFFNTVGKGSLSLDQLARLQQELVIKGRKHPLYVVVYDFQLGLSIQEHLKHCDKITFWTWTADKLQELDRNFARLEEIAPDTGKLLGCYLWDYGRKRPLSLEMMQQQCETGLQLLRAGRIEGMVFLGSNICDIELPTVEYTRKWIAEVGGQQI